MRSKSFLFPFFFRLYKFSLSSASGLVVDTAVLFVLSRFIFKSEFLIYFIAPVISFEFAVFNNFNISYYWVWKDRKGATSSYFKTLLNYHLISITAFVVKMTVLILTMQLFHFDVILCNFIGLCFGFFVNFLGGDKFVFKRKVL